MTQLTYLTKDVIAEVHSSTLQLLANTGMHICNEEAKQILKKAGCTVEEDLVKFPEALVEESLKTTPSEFSLYSRDGATSFPIGQDEVLINPGSSAVYFKDRGTKEIRKATSKTLVDLIHVTEHLEHIKAQSTALIPSDVHGDIVGLYRLYAI